jgi:hypothetical protein
LEEAILGGDIALHEEGIFLGSGLYVRLSQRVEPYSYRMGDSGLDGSGSLG